MWKPTCQKIHWYPQPTSDELYHHGILGQKWGKKNGPPYPLDASNHSAAEKKAGWKKSLNNGASSLKKTAKKHPILTTAALSGNQPEILLLANQADKKKSNKNKEEAISIIDKYKGNYKHGFLEGDEEKVVKNAIIDDEEVICSKMADEVISDIQRWKKEGYESTIGEKGDEELIKKDLSHNLKNSRNFFAAGDGHVYFVMNGMEYYADSQPLDVDYDLKTKKLSYGWA